MLAHVKTASAATRMPPIWRGSSPRKSLSIYASTRSNSLRHHRPMLTIATDARTQAIHANEAREIRQRTSAPSLPCPARMIVLLRPQARI